MCSFRPLSEISNFLQTVPELRALFDEASVQRFVDVVSAPESTENEKKMVLKDVYMQMLHVSNREADKPKLDAQILALSTRLQNSSQLNLTTSTFLDLTQQYPGDGGCFQVFFLNIAILEPGQGLFLAANEPHAYLRGDAVEIMARSDNVVRAGLTPKFKDVEVMGGMLSYDTQELHIFTPNREGPLTSYCPPPEYPDFKLLRIHLQKTSVLDWSCTTYELKDSSGCLLCVQGIAKLFYCVMGCQSPPRGMIVEAGKAYFLPANLVLYFAMQEEFVAFIGEAQTQI
jgi:mannose-6-phosphate isomerase